MSNLNARFGLGLALTVVVSGGVLRTSCILHAVMNTALFRRWWIHITPEYMTIFDASGRYEHRIIPSVVVVEDGLNASRCHEHCLISNETNYTYTKYFSDALKYFSNRILL